MTLTGRNAIRYAEANDLTLNKHNDPTEGPRTGLTVDSDNEDEYLGELTYDLPMAGHRSLPVTGASIADVQRQIDNLLAMGARAVRWSKCDNANECIEAEDLRLS